MPFKPGDRLLVIKLLKGNANMNGFLCLHVNDGQFFFVSFTDYHIHS